MPVQVDKKINSRSKGCASTCLEWLFFASIFSVLLFALLSLMAAFDIPVPARAGPEEPSVFVAALQSNQQPESCQVSSLFPEKVRQWCDLITHYSLEHALPPDLIAALIWQESGGNALAYSHSGAVGLMQVMPRDGIATKFMCKNGPCFADRPTIADLRDAESNISFGTGMLRDLINYHKGDVRKALKSYGPMDVGFHYADVVLALYHRYGSHSLQ